MAAQDYYNPASHAAPPYPPSPPQAGTRPNSSPHVTFNMEPLSATSPPPYEPFPPQHHQQQSQQQSPAQQHSQPYLAQTNDHGAPGAPPVHHQGQGPLTPMAQGNYSEKPQIQHQQFPPQHPSQGKDGYAQSPLPPQHQQHPPQQYPPQQYQHQQQQHYQQQHVQYATATKPPQQAYYGSPRMSGAYAPHSGNLYPPQSAGYPPPPQGYQSYGAPAYGLPSPATSGRPHSQPPPNAFPPNGRPHSGSRPPRPQSPRRRRSDSRERYHHHKHHDRPRSSTKKSESGLGTFLGAGGGAIVGDAIFPGLGTVGGALLGGYGGHQYSKDKTRRGSDSRLPRRRHDDEYYYDDRRGRR